jgi:glutathione peroxidase
MKKFAIAVMGVALLFSCQNQAQTKKTKTTKETTKTMSASNIYGFKVTDLYGKEFDFASLKGKKVMIVNTASKCGLTC